MGALDGNSAAFAAVAGFFVLFHACYAVIAHNDNLKLAGEEFAAVPLGVVLECVAGAALCAWGACGDAAGGRAAGDGARWGFHDLQPPRRGDREGGGEVIAIAAARRRADGERDCWFLSVVARKRLTKTKTPPVDSPRPSRQNVSSALASEFLRTVTTTGSASVFHSGPTVVPSIFVRRRRRKPSRGDLDAQRPVRHSSADAAVQAGHVAPPRAIGTRPRERDRVQRRRVVLVDGPSEPLDGGVFVARVVDGDDAEVPRLVIHREVRVVRVPGRRVIHADDVHDDVVRGNAKRRPSYVRRVPVIPAAIPRRVDALLAVVEQDLRTRVLRRDEVADAREVRRDRARDGGDCRE
eukprot:30886-Pelagococcus_subviridis.AAC.19